MHVLKVKTIIFIYHYDIHDGIMSSICKHCRRVVDEFEGLVEESVWYHTECYYYILKTKVEKLQKKLDFKTITLDEAEELTDLNLVLSNVKKVIATPTIKQRDIFNQKKPVFFGESVGMQNLNDHKQDLEKHNIAKKRSLFSSLEEDQTLQIN